MSMPRAQWSLSQRSRAHSPLMADGLGSNGHPVPAHAAWGDSSSAGLRVTLRSAAWKREQRLAMIKCILVVNNQAAAFKRVCIGHLHFQNFRGSWRPIVWQLDCCSDHCFLFNLTTGDRTPFSSCVCCVMVHVPMPTPQLTLGDVMEVMKEVKMAPGSGYLSVKPGVKVKVLYIGSADEEGWIFAETESAERGWLSTDSAAPRDVQNLERKIQPHVKTALRGWLAERPGHLRIRKGDQLYVERQEPGWLYGFVSQGTYGWFSDEVLTKPPPPKGPRPGALLQPRWPDFLVGQRAPKVPWNYVLEDRGCFAASLPAEKVASLLGNVENKAWGTYWVKRVAQGIEDLGGFDRPSGPLGVIARGTKWLVKEGCSCPYRYSGMEVDAYPFPPWMDDLLEQVMSLCGLREEEWPNACNVNLYVGTDGLSWHADDEPLMDTEDGNCCIISLSLGQEGS
eukprot:s2913_g5.t1